MLLFLNLFLAQILAQSLQRLSIKVECQNGSEFNLKHDAHDTRLYLSSEQYTMIVHSRDNYFLRADIIKFNADGCAEEQYEITDMNKKASHPMTKMVIEELKRKCPDIHFMIEEIKQNGLRRTTQVRKWLPTKVRIVFPSLPTVYERVLYGALGSFLYKLEDRLPKELQLYQKEDEIPEWKKKYIKAKRSNTRREFTFEFEDKRRPAKMDVSSRGDDFNVKIMTHHESVKQIYADDTYYNE